MKNLIRFFVNYGIYFLFIILEISALLLVVNNNSFQQSVFWQSCNNVNGKVYAWNRSVWDYFSLKQVNKDLAVENAELRNKLALYDNQYHSMLADSLQPSVFVLSPEREYSCLSAKVINNSTNKLQNYITLNKGQADGVRREMSVVNSQGVIGIVKAVSERFSVVMPILNPKLQVSCKIKRNGNTANTLGQIKDIGSLVWDGTDYRFADMLQVPRHVPIKKGDTVVTSGYSDYFPEGILIGRIEEFTKASDDNYYNIKVRLAVNFRTISYVYVLEYRHREEQQKLEQQVAK
ncbi:MAG: rod shape-determining protein MreC [Prevotellaceae bacterium]|jgi:rod shape-determining protein MreC|nr:rod shape-determining protein MreC [Prevotellaceae bacterium]